MDNKKILILIIGIILMIFTCLFFIKNRQTMNTTEVQTQEEVLLPKSTEDTNVQEATQTEEEKIQNFDRVERVNTTLQVQSQQIVKPQKTPLKIQEETQTSVPPSEISQLDVQVEYNPKNFEVPVKFKSSNIKKFVYTPDGFYK